MSVRRSQNWLNQQRVDVPHLRSIESAVRNDFDELLSSFAIGENASYIIRGFEINMIGAIGSSASSLQMIVENSSLFHGASNEAGTFFQIPSGSANQTISSTTNTRVQGSFTPSALNYVGIEFSRAVDNSTSAQVFLWNPTNKNEISKTVPLAEVLDYKIVVTSSIWASNVVPIAIVETDSSNNTLRVEDRRPMLFRLGTAGVNTPNPFYSYPWTNQAEGRAENFWSSSSSVSPFRGGDKQIFHFKEWADAVMSQILELKGTTYWYEQNTSVGSVTKLKGDLEQLQMTGSGKISHALNTAGRLNWDSDIYLNYVGSRLKYKILSNPSSSHITLADDQVAYFKIVRGVDIIPNIIFTQGSAVVSSVGAVAWTSNVQAGDYIKLTVSEDTLYYKILSVDSASQVTLTENYVETSTGSGGTLAQYAWGTYQTNAAPSTDRHIKVANRKDVPFDEDIYWMFLRADDGGATARIYIKGSSGGELQQGEDRGISDNETLDVLEYIGSPAEVDTTPDYTNAITTGIAESRTITFPAGSLITSGKYFTINSSLDIIKNYVDATVNGVPNDPAPAGLTRINVAILSTDTAAQVAAKYAAALAVSQYSVTYTPGNAFLVIANSQVGASSDAANVNMPVGFSIVTNIDGAGSFNNTVVDDDNLTKSIKRLDEAVQQIDIALDVKPYEEPIEIISGAPANDRELTGPIAASTSIKIPKNTRNSNVQESYVLTEGDLVIYLNGTRLKVGLDYTELTTTTVSFTFQLQVQDHLVFSKAQMVGGSSGSSSTGVNLGAVQDANVFKQTVGTQLQFRRLKAGSNVTLTESSDYITIASSAGIANSNVTVISGTNYSVTNANDVVLLQNLGADRTLTLPDATLNAGKIFYFKKIDAGNTMFIKSILSQTLDGVDIDASPYAVTVQYESLTIVAVAGAWYIL
jgi:hypothetical protein